MSVVVIKKTAIGMQQYDNVTNIAVNNSTQVVTISYGTSSTATCSLSDSSLFIIN